MKHKSDVFGNRMKTYESISDDILIPGLPVYVRLDGCAFHTFCKGLKKPFDERLSNAMIETTKFLVKKTNAVVGYTQSDEISLLFIPKENEHIQLFGGRKYKISTTLAASAAVKFNQCIAESIPEKAHLLPIFDCRLHNTPSIKEAVNTFRWREWDAKKNSVSMAASSIASESTLNKVNGLGRKQILAENSIDWNSYPSHFKYGTYVKRKTIEKEFSHDELSRIPESFRTVKSAKRSVITILDIPHVSLIKNYEDVLINGIDPILYSMEELKAKGADV